MDAEDRLYIDQMNNWFKEHKLIEEQLKRSVDYYKTLSNTNERLAKTNKEQLRLHRKRVALAREEFENWKKDNGIEV